MNKEIKNEVRELVEKDFYEMCIEELENVNVEDMLDWIGDYIYEDFDIEIKENEELENEIIEMIEELKEEYLEGKNEEWEEMNSLRMDLLSGRW